MYELQRGWQKEEFTSPDIVWDLDLDGVFVEKREDKKTKKKVDKEIKISGSNVKLVYLYLIRCLEIDKKVMPSISEIARHTQIGERTVIRCISHLENLGLIVKHHRFYINEEGKKVNLKNAYIVNHPKQVPNLPMIEPTATVAEPLPPQWHNPTATVAEPLMPQWHNPTAMVADYISSSSNNKYSSVVDNEDFQKLNAVWKDCFQEDLEDWEFNSLIKLKDIDYIIRQVELIKEHHDLSTIESAYAFVSKCLKNKNGYKVPKKKKAHPKQAKKEKKRDYSNLPETVRNQLEGKDESEMTPEELEEYKKLLIEKKKEMDQVFAERKKKMRDEGNF